MKGIFRNKDGQLSAYSLACGYLQVSSPTGIQDKSNYMENQVHLYSDCGTPMVKTYVKGERECWEVFNTLGEARKCFWEWTKKLGFKLIKGD